MLFSLPNYTSARDALNEDKVKHLFGTVGSEFGIVIVWIPIEKTL